MSAKFNIVFTGKKRAGMSDALAIDLLASIFKIAPEMAKQVLARAPIIIKRNLSQAEADTYIMRLEHIGFDAREEAVLQNSEMDRFDQSLIMDKSPLHS